MTRRVSAFERLVAARVASAVSRPLTGECWSWDGSRDRKGYGFISVNGKTRRVHIVAFELATGRKVRKGHTVEHTCRNPSCWRPSHFEEITRAENTARGNRANPRSTEKARRVRAATMARAAEIMASGRDPVFDDGHGGIG